MILKEVLQARWKVLIFAFLALVASAGNIVKFFYARYLQASGSAVAPIFQEMVHDPLVKDYPAFAWNHWFATNGPLVVILFAAVLGGGLIAEEARRGTIFFLLSKPISRTRLLLTKYAVSAGLLLAVSVMSSLVLALAGLTLGQPLAVLPLLLATGLLWLVALVPLGLALFFSILFSDALRPVVFSLLVMTAMLLLPFILPSGELWSLGRSWQEQQASLMGGFPLLASLICLIAALVPLLAAQLVFRKKAY
ncbi:ABC transporter permease [Ktedonosporobacter rubrisoli]|uniref:ABC transporter permease n=1 Tax=Ktedonosporobacter rubrisoli TaxID=2509675 RepID=A0A4P6K4V6_KTERU|nr:ABC transporter permease subunit [Ktedonosporobacter rubrisoli]QBD83002.1 ABC transporter permease [Ktedonosporobacter rubrisoli]